MEPLEKQIKALEVKYGAEKVEEAINEMLWKRTEKFSTAFPQGKKKRARRRTRT